MATKSERLVILLSKDEKARLAKLAKRQRVSMGDLVRGALLLQDSPEPASRASVQYRQARTHGHRALRERRPRFDRGDGAPGGGVAAMPGEFDLSAEQERALERLADVALQTMERANAALDRAFEALEATKRHFDAKRVGAASDKRSGRDAGARTKPRAARKAGG